MVLDILIFIAAIATIFCAYRIYIARKRNVEWKQIRGFKYSLITCIILIWLINIYTGFIK